MNSDMCACVNLKVNKNRIIFKLKIGTNIYRHLKLYNIIT